MNHNNWIVMVLIAGKSTKKSKNGKGKGKKGIIEIEHTEEMPKLFISRYWKFIAVVTLRMVSVGMTQDHPTPDDTPRITAARRYIFEPIEIRPSPNGWDYQGRFRFENKTAAPIKLSGFGEPIDGKFEPYFIDFQVTRDGKWMQLESSSCGLPLAYSIEPNKPYELRVDLSLFVEQKDPLTARIGIENQRYWSEPFILDWKKDRKAGHFLSAKKEHFQKLRAAFAKAGFKKEMLVGDDFCDRLFESVLKSMSSAVKHGSFDPVREKLNVMPWFRLDGDIDIRFECGEALGVRHQYNVMLRLDPEKFNRPLFEDSRKKKVRAYIMEDKSLMMRINVELENKTADKVFEFAIQYRVLEDLGTPSEIEAEKAFQRALGVLAGWLDTR